MRPKAIVFPSPALDKDLRFRQRIQHLAVEELIPQLPDIGLNISVFPGASGLDEEGGHAKVFEPSPDRVCRELRAVIRPNMFGHPTHQEQFIELFENILGPDPPGNIHG